MLRIHRFVAVIWLIFALLFFGMAGFHLHLSGQAAPDLSVIGRPFEASINGQIAGANVDKPLHDFAGQFNEYVHAQNATSRLENLFAMGGYLLAGLTALLSLYLELVAVREKNRDIEKNRAA